MESCSFSGIKQESNLQTDTVHETTTQCPGLKECLLRNASRIYATEDATRLAACNQNNAQTQQNQ